MRFDASSTSFVALAAVGTVINAASCKAQCNANNCLRAFRHEDVITAARSFCSSYTTVTTWTAPLPTFANPCSASASRISSACSCIASSSSSTSVASTSSRTSSTTVSTSTTSSRPTSTSSGSSTSTSVTTSSLTSSPSPSSTSFSSTSSGPSSSSSSSASQTSSTSSSSVSTTSSASSTPVCNTATPSTVFVTVPASTVTVTSNSTTTVTAYSYPSNANQGATNLPNPNFESPIPSPPTDYCSNVPATARCSIVQTSDPGFSTTFSGLFGPGMLRVSASNSEGSLSDFRVPVPIVSTPHPQGRDWVLTAWYRSDPGNPYGCWPIMGFYSDDGFGFGFQPDYADDGTWQRFSRELPGSAQGNPRSWGAYVTSGCYPGAGHMYVDGVTIT